MSSGGVCGWPPHPQPDHVDLCPGGNHTCVPPSRRGSRMVDEMVVLWVLQSPPPHNPQAAKVASWAVVDRPRLSTQRHPNVGRGALANSQDGGLCRPRKTGPRPSPRRDACRLGRRAPWLWRWIPGPTTASCAASGYRVRRACARAIQLSHIPARLGHVHLRRLPGAQGGLSLHAQGWQHFHTPSACPRLWRDPGQPDAWRHRLRQQV